MSTEDEKRVLDKNIADGIHAMAKALGEAVILGRITCVHCMHFGTDERCALVDARPPAKVIAFGCEAFAPTIPF